MNRHINIILILVTGCLLCTTSMLAQSPAKTKELSVWRSRAALVSAGQYAGAVWVTTHRYYSVLTDTIQLTPTELTMEARNSKGQTLHLRVALNELRTYITNGYALVDDQKKTFSMADDVDHKKYMINFGDDNRIWAHPHCDQASNKEDCLHSAERFAAGLNGLRTWAQQNHASTDSFPQKAGAWKALATKRPLSEDVRIRRALAEDAIQQQKPEEGLNYYELGLQIDPTWAQGWFNAAVIAGNLGYYADAAEHMQNYLELIPDATDAEKAREQMGIWQYKARNK